MATAAFLRRVLWLTSIFAVLLAGRGEASSGVTADFDGDGHADWVSIDHREPSIIQVWLSGTGTTTRIRTRRPVLQLAARDLDGDHVPELITAEDGGTARSKSGRILRVWTRDGRHGFRTFRPKRHTPAAMKAPARQRFNQGDPADESTGHMDGGQHPRGSATARGPTSDSTPPGRLVRSRSADAEFSSYVPLEKTSPRPPPARPLA